MVHTETHKISMQRSQNAGNTWIIIDCFHDGRLELLKSCCLF